MSAAFASSFDAFDATSSQHKLGQLAEADAMRGFATSYSRQTGAWLYELDMISCFTRHCIARMENSRKWTILLEFDIPRRGKRPDAIVLADDIIFVLEFKVGASEFLSADEWQVFSYALDLRDFHSESQGRLIIPILIATACTHSVRCDTHALAQEDGACFVQLSSDAVGDATGSLICNLYDRLHKPDRGSIDAANWNEGAYRPTPSIIEAATRIFAGHGVADISHAFAHNLDATCCALIDAIRDAERRKRRLICFVTGIPGAGKTLAGLNVVHHPFFRENGRRAAVFLSGNGPLVKIVRAALVRDQQKGGCSADEAKRTVASFIDSVHRFVSTYGIQKPNSSPYENVIVFDEAQRAWDQVAVERKHHIERSEPALVLDAMERATDWCAVIALVGGGQEIHKGEAGLLEWGHALNERSVAWDVCVSPQVLSGGEAVAGHVLFDSMPGTHLSVCPIPTLHLDVSVRSPRARRLADWVNQFLRGEIPQSESCEQIGVEFPIVMTRDLATARHWLRRQSEGQQSSGLLASSGALRLRVDGIEVSSGFRRAYPFDEWFLATRDDTRSSNWLEVAATEFECQGLELDWTCLC